MHKERRRGRNKKERCCRRLDKGRIFKPQGVRLYELEASEVQYDELEAVRLCDYEGKSQIEAALSMGISRGTVQRLLQSGRFKIIDAIINVKSIKINN